MVGDVTDIVGRIRAVLPKRWFSEQPPNLIGLLTGIATPLSWLYSLLTYVVTQSRLTTASDFWLDLAAFDFFGSEFTRRPQESDASLLSRIQQTMFQEAATRPALVSALAALTGKTPVVFEPARCLDTGSYGHGNMASSDGGAVGYGQAGGWGNLQMPGQFFITVYTPSTPVVGNLSGYGVPAAGYGSGPLSYIDFSSLAGNVTSTEIEWQVCRLLPANATAWLCIN